MTQPAAELAVEPETAEAASRRRPALSPSRVADFKSRYPGIAAQ